MSEVAGSMPDPQAASAANRGALQRISLNEDVTHAEL